MLAGYYNAEFKGSPKSEADVTVAGMQLEFPVELEVPAKLDELARSVPRAEILVLSEYTFDGPLPAKIKSWCRAHSKYLVVGAKEMLDATNFYNTAYVIGPYGDVVFKQVKSVPIQFFKDGLPAPEQNVWESPWGEIGICICYDLSYRRVVDELVRKGAKALIVPTMDVVDWGRRQHELHALIAPARAAEYGIPIFRVASSGFSQVVYENGKVATSAPSPGQGAIISGSLAMDTHPSVPIDAVLGPICVAISGLVLVAALIPKPKTA
jgi:predicted amidohydrolase